MKPSAERQRVFAILVPLLSAPAIVADYLFKRLAVLEPGLVAWRIVEEVG